MNTLYTTTATATGDGRNGHVASADGILDLELKMPKGLGGPGGTTNPEQLFAAGYASCFHSALKLVGREQGVDVTDTVVQARVSIGQTEEGAFQLAVTLSVTVPNATADVAREAVHAAHQVCPYSRATRGNIDVVLEVTE